MRILVTGGAGFIGKHILEWLLQGRHTVQVLDDFSTGRPSHVPPSIEAIDVDLTTLSVANFVARLENAKPDGVIHLAAMHFIPDCMARPERTFALNTGVTHTLVEALVLHPVHRVVFASTMDVYSTEDRPHSEADTLSPANVYGLSKAISEQIMAYGHRRGIAKSVVALRLANVYGPDETNPHLVPDVIDRIANPKGNALVMGYLGATRDFVFVKDVAAAFGMAVTNAAEGFHCLNVGTGHPVAVREVVRTLQSMLGDTRSIQENPGVFRKFDRASLTPRVELIRKTLEWHATRSVSEGLLETIQTLAVAPVN